MSPTISHIKRATAAAFHVPPSEMTSRAHTYRFAHPRQAAMFLTRRLTTHSFPMIGKHFRRDHTTVLYAHRACLARMDENIEYAVRVEIAEWGARFLADYARCCIPIADQNEAH